LEHADTLLLAAQVMSYIINRAKANGGGREVTRGLIAELLQFCHAPFRDACRAPPGRGKDQHFLETTDRLIAEGAILLQQTFALHAPEETAALFEEGPRFLSELLGSFEYNNIDVEVNSPLGQFFLQRARNLVAAGPLQGGPVAQELSLLEMFLREKEWVMRCTWGEETTGIFGDDGDVDAMADADNSMPEGTDQDDDAVDAQVANTAMAEAREVVSKMTMEQLVEAKWPNFHGTGLFASVARMNHSCEPNMKVDFPGNSAKLRAFALRPMNAGDELCISYIEQGADVQTRRRQLLEYGFTCVCDKCLREDSVATRKAGKRLK
jgi:hypothetical protein